MPFNLEINGTRLEVDPAPGKPLLWVLREDLGLTGTKFGCGVAACGACTVIIGGQAVRSCILPFEAAVGQPIRTIEGLSSATLHPVQQAWIDAQVPQCGYCQAGFILSAIAALEANPAATAAELTAALTNICRCGSYDAMRAAIRQLTQLAAAPANTSEA